MTLSYNRLESTPHTSTTTVTTPISVDQCLRTFESYRAVASTHLLGLIASPKVHSVSKHRRREFTTRTPRVRTDFYDQTSFCQGAIRCKPLQHLRSIRESIVTTLINGTRAQVWERNLHPTNQTVFLEEVLSTQGQNESFWQSPLFFFDPHSKSDEVLIPLEYFVNFDSDACYLDEDCDKEVVAFLNAAYEYSSTKRIRQGINHILSQMNDWLCEQRFDHCDEALKHADLEMLGIDLTLSFITITRAAKDKLTERDDFFDQASQMFERLLGRETSNRLLQNLG